MTSHDLYGAMKGPTDDSFYHQIPHQTYTEDWQKLMKKIGESGWSRCSHLFFHPDGRLCATIDFRSKDLLEAAPPPPAGDWDWVKIYSQQSSSSSLERQKAENGTSLDSEKEIKWPKYKFLFFDPDGQLYGVPDDKLYKGAFTNDQEAQQWLNSAKLVGVSGWASYDFLFFDPEGILYGVKNGKFHRRSPPTDTSDDWLESSTLIGTTGWSDFKFLFFMSNGELYGVHQDNFYKGSPPTQAVSSDEWLNSSTLIGKGGWNQFKFLISPVKELACHCMRNDRA